MPLATIPMAQVPSSSPPTSYQIAVGASGVWVINADGSVARIDPAVNPVVDTVRGLDVSGIASGAGGMRALENTRVGSIAQLSPGSTASNLIAHSDASRGSVTRSLLASCTRSGILGSFCFNANGDPTMAPVTILQAARPGTLEHLDTTGTDVADVIAARESWTR